MNNNFDPKTTVGEIVANDFRTAEIFSRAGIDFCCNGKMSLEDSCKDKNLDIDTLQSELAQVAQSPRSPSQNFMEWDLGFLSDYIVNTHHRYIYKALPELLFYTQKIWSVHGESHPELEEIANLFQQVNDEITTHMKHEEDVLFPAIKRMVLEANDKDRAIIHEEINRMWGEHEFVGGSMDKINQLSGAYAVPADACNTYMITFQKLKEFEDNIHVHVHLENNILFPKAVNL